MPLDTPEYQKIHMALLQWAVTAGLGPLLRDVHIHIDGHVLRWPQVSITLRTNHRRRPAPSVSYMNQEFPPLPYTVDKDGIRHFPDEGQN